MLGWNSTSGQRKRSAPRVMTCSSQQAMGHVAVWPVGLQMHRGWIAPGRQAAHSASQALSLTGRWPSPAQSQVPRSKASLQTQCRCIRVCSLVLDQIMCVTNTKPMQSQQLYCVVG
jgi:hypothetical protein